MRLHIVPFLLILAACKPSGGSTGSTGAPPTTASASVSAKPAPTSTAPAAASAAVAKLVDGGKLLPIFAPFAAAAGATERVDRPTKEGYAEVVYKKGKDDLATVTISDTTGVPGVRDDYKDAKETVDKFPLKTSGYTKSAILVADRFQVQVQSQRMKAPERKALLEKMDLKALQALK